MNRKAALTGLLVLLAVGAAGCKKKQEGPVAGLLAAGAPLYLETKKGEKPLVVGSQLNPSDRVRASGPAAIEYFGGAVVFLEKGDRVTVDETDESKLLGSNLRARAFLKGELQEVPQPNRIVAARYRSVMFTPENAGLSGPTQGDYFKAFFTPNGIEKLGGGVAKHEGPRNELPPPPLRTKVPHIRADALGQGGHTLEVRSGWVVAETDELVTAVLEEDQTFDLGRTVRLVVPYDAKAKLTLKDGRRFDLKGPSDVALR